MTKPFDQIKTSLDKLRRESLDVVGQANRIVSQGVHRLAEHELKALNDTYRTVLGALKDAKKGDSIKDVAGKQLDVMQDSVNRLIASTRESLAILSDTRQELTGLVSGGLKTGAVAEAELAKVADKAKKAVAGVKVAAADAQKKAGQVTAQAKASADKVAASVKSDAKKVAAAVKKDVSVARQRVGSVLDIKPKGAPVKKPVVAVKPSANSRANRATSKAKSAASSVIESVKKMG